jgi:hypothetical protein
LTGSLKLSRNATISASLGGVTLGERFDHVDAGADALLAGKVQVRRHLAGGEAR